MTDSDAELTYINGFFDEESKEKIEQLDKTYPGFSDSIYDISKNFYGFGVDYSTEDIDYSTRLTRIKGCTIDVNVINKPDISEAEKKSIDDKIVHLIKSYRRHNERMGRDLISDLANIYLEERNKGKYAKISQTGIEIYNELPIVGLEEVYFHIGDEFKVSASIFYSSKIYNAYPHSY